MRLQIEEEARECRKIAQRWEPGHDNYVLHITRARALEWVLKLIDEAILEDYLEDYLNKEKRAEP